MMKTETRLAALALGMTNEAIARYDSVALAIGPKTTLENGAVYDAAWEVRLGYLKRGESFPPDRSLIWAARIWLVLVQLGVIDLREAMFSLAMIGDVATELWGDL